MSVGQDEVKERRPSISQGRLWLRIKAMLRFVYKTLGCNAGRFPTSVSTFAETRPVVKTVKNRFESVTFSARLTQEGLVSYSQPLVIGRRLPIEGETGRPYRLRSRHIAATPSVDTYSIADGTITGWEGFAYDPKTYKYVRETMPRWFDWDRDMELSYRSAIWPSPMEHVAGVTFSIAKRAGANYYHFLHEGLPSLLLMQRRFPNIAFDHVVVSGPRCVFKLAWLELAGIPESQIIFTDHNSHLRCEQLMWTSDLSYHYSPNELIVDLLRDLRPAVDFEHDAANEEFLVASRANAGHRRLSWEQELADRYDASLIDFSSLSPVEVMRRCRNARVFAGCHGAAFANTVFCKPNTAVFEIAAQVDHVLYSRVSSVCKLAHHVVDMEERDALFQYLDDYLREGV